MNRRHILKQSTLVGAASFLPMMSVLGASSDSVGARLSSSLSTYSKKSHRDVLPDGTVRIVGSIDDLAAFQEADIHGNLSRMTATDLKVKAEGNLLSFSHRNTSYQIEHVMPGQFRKAIS